MGRRKRPPRKHTAEEEPNLKRTTNRQSFLRRGARLLTRASTSSQGLLIGLLLIPLSVVSCYLARPRRDLDLAPAADSWDCKDGCQTHGAYGGRHYFYGPSRGFYATGCQWREVSFDDSEDVLYEYWTGRPAKWVAARPTACTLMAQAQAVPARYTWNKAVEHQSLHSTPATAVIPKDTHVLMKNLWYNNGRWYALVEDGERFVNNIKISRNQQITCLHVENATRWAANTKHVLIQRHTLLFDYIYFQHPTAIGHWMEMMFPLSSILKNSSFGPPDVNVILLHLKRKHLMEWSRAIMATTLSVAARQALPPIWLQEETDILTEQPTMPLEGVPADLWVAFDTVMITRDLFTGGKRSFATTRDAREFRAGVYHNHGLSVPQSTPHAIPPQRITYQRKRANRRIVNEAEVLQLFEGYAPVDIVEFNASHSFQTQIEAMSRTGIFVGTHTSNLANTVFLPPGSAVVELIQRFWYWMNLDKSFKDQTDQLADVHHFAWRAFHANQTVYLNARDRFRFSNWTTAQCRIQDCVEAHTNVDIIVDIPELKAMLDARLPRVLAGASVPELLSVWPSNEPSQPQPWRTPPGQTA